MYSHRNPRTSVFLLTVFLPQILLHFWRFLLMGLLTSGFVRIQNKYITKTTNFELGMTIIKALNI